jgi:hypothetical protein
MTQDTQRNANTDNKGHLFVTVFELPAFYTVIHISLNPDNAPLLPIKVLYHDKFLAPLAACTATLHQWSFIKILYGDSILLI